MDMSVNEFIELLKKSNPGLDVAEISSFPQEFLAAKESFVRHNAIYYADADTFIVRVNGDFNLPSEKDGIGLEFKSWRNNEYEGEVSLDKSTVPSDFDLINIGETEFYIIGGSAKKKTNAQEIAPFETFEDVLSFIKDKTNGNFDEKALIDYVLKYFGNLVADHKDLKIPSSSNNIVSSSEAEPKKDMPLDEYFSRAVFDTFRDKLSSQVDPSLSDSEQIEKHGYCTKQLYLQPVVDKFLGRIQSSFDEGFWKKMRSGNIDNIELFIASKGKKLVSVYPYRYTLEKVIPLLVNLDNTSLLKLCDELNSKSKDENDSKMQLAAQLVELDTMANDFQDSIGNMKI